MTTGDVSSPLVVPPGPLAAAAFESGMSAVDELKLLKTQVQDVARVCNAVARGDLSQKITVPVQGVVMIQLKDVINAMVRPFPRLVLSSPPRQAPALISARPRPCAGRQTRSVRKGGHSCLPGGRHGRVRLSLPPQISPPIICATRPHTPRR